MFWRGSEWQPYEVGIPDTGHETECVKPFASASHGGAYVRMVETADALLARKPFWIEKLLLRIMRALYSHRLREVVAVLPPKLTDEVMAASERMTNFILPVASQQDGGIKPIVSLKPVATTAVITARGNK